MIYTVGYQGAKIERIRRIADSLNATVVDVRGVPRSRNPVWNRATWNASYPSICGVETRSGTTARTW